MVDIMETLHTYVPTTDTTPTSPGHIAVLFGGDQLTAARARGAKRAVMNGATFQKRLEGIYPVAEDWHAKMNFLDVS